LLVASHERHRAASVWFDQVAASEVALLRAVQISLIRLLANPAVVGKRAVSAAEAWLVIEQLLADERIDLIPEPPQTESVFPLMLRYRTPLTTLSPMPGWQRSPLRPPAGSRHSMPAFRQFKGRDLVVLRP
jgi:predicted nucleic acid-binding protein